MYSKKGPDHFQYPHLPRFKHKEHSHTVRDGIPSQVATTIPNGSARSLTCI